MNIAHITLVNMRVSFWNSTKAAARFLKSNFKCKLQKHHFVYVYKVIIKSYLNFITCLYFPLALIWWYSNHCNLMELFKTKETSKEKVDSNNNWKQHGQEWFFLGWQLFLRLSLGYVWKMWSFAGKHLSFYQKDFSSFPVFFCFFFFNSKTP